MCATNSVGEDIQLLSGPWEDFSISKTLQHLVTVYGSSHQEHCSNSEIREVESTRSGSICTRPRDIIGLVQGFGLSECERKCAAAVGQCIQ